MKPSISAGYGDNLIECMFCEIMGFGGSTDRVDRQMATKFGFDDLMMDRRHGSEV